MNPRYEGLDDEEIARIKAERDVARDVRRARRLPALKAVHAICRRLPLPVAAVLGHAVGRLIWRFHRPSRKRILDHVTIAYGEDLSARERRRIARRSLGLVAAGLLSYQVLHRMGVERALGHLDVVGAENLTAALAPGKGCLIVSFHYGLFELAASWAGTRFEAAAVGRPTRGVATIETHTEMRADLGCETIQRGDARGVLRVLRAGRPMVMLADHDVRRLNGVFVPFFGRLAHTPAGPASLAIRCGVPIVMAFTEWRGLTRHELDLSAPIWAREDLSGDEQVLELTHRYTQIGERRVRERPDHWIWLHKRWETRPEQRPDLPVLRIDGASDGRRVARDSPPEAPPGTSGAVGAEG